MISTPCILEGVDLMGGDDFTLDPNRRDRLIDRVDEILHRKGPEWQLRSRQDVLILAVQKLWAETLLADSEAIPSLQGSIAD